MKLVLPLPPNRANDRSHWRKVHREKCAYYGAAKARIWQQSTGTQRAQYFCANVIVTATLYVWNLFDDDGATALLKWPLDSLKLTGAIRDDKRPWCALSGIPNQVIDRKNQRVELTLERV